MGLRYEDFISDDPIDSVSQLPIVGVYGGFQVGKSTLLNCLLGSYSSLVGKGLATTFLVTRFRFADACSTKFRTKPDSPDQGNLKEVSLSEIRRNSFKEKVDLLSGFHVESFLPAKILKYCEIVDTPGYNANQEDSEIALNAIKHINYALFIMSNSFALSQPEKELLIKLRDEKVPTSIIMNCNSRFHANDRWITTNSFNDTLASNCESWLANSQITPIPISGQKVFLCNLLFYWSQTECFEQSRCDIESPDSLKKHIANSLEEYWLPNDSQTIVEISKFPLLYTGLIENLKKYNPIKRKFEF